MRLYLALTAAAIALFVAWPELDLRVQALFHRPGEGFFLKDSLFAVVFYEGIRVLVIVAAIRLIVAIAQGALRRRATWKAPAYLLLVLALGPGLVVNSGLKDNWGRARPSQVRQFGGDKIFTPPLLPADQCARNCSFVAGHPSVLFALFGGVFLLRRRRAAAMAAVAGAGALAGLGRIMQGGHFLSDVVFSGLVTWIVAWGLYEVLIRRGGFDAMGRAPPWLRGAAVSLVPAGALYAVGVLWLDRPLARWFKSFDDSVVTDWFRHLAWLGDATGYLVVSAAVGLTFWWLARRVADGASAARWRGYAWRAGFVFATLAVQGLWVNGLKIVLGRARPRLLFSEDLYGFEPWHLDPDFWSSPSGHTATAVSLATALALMWPRYTPIYATLAALVAANRMVTSVHYAADVVFGAWIAIVVAFALRHWFERAGAEIFPARA